MAMNGMAPSGVTPSFIGLGLVATLLFRVVCVSMNSLSIFPSLPHLYSCMKLPLLPFPS